MIWYISVEAHSCTEMVSVAELSPPAGGVTLVRLKLQVIPGGEPAERVTGELKSLMEVRQMVIW